MQHFIHHLSPSGVAGFVLANTSTSSDISNEGVIRKNIVEADLVDCMIALPKQLFYNTPISACLWFISRDKKNHKFRDRRNQVLFIDVRNLGTMIDRSHRELIDKDIKKISDTYHAWRGELKNKKYHDIAGFCKSVSLEEIRKRKFVLTPGGYVGAEEEKDDEEEFEEKMKQLTTELSEQMKQGQKLEREIKKSLGNIGFKI